MRKSCGAGAQRCLRGGMHGGIWRQQLCWSIQDPALAVTVGGRLYTWRYGLDLQLGYGDPGNRPVPTLIGAGAFGERRW